MFMQKEVAVKHVKWNGEKEVEFEFSDGSYWCVKRKDFWRTHDWEKIIKQGSALRLWTINLSCVVGFEAYYKNEFAWLPVWCAVNDFETQAESDRSAKAYNDFVIKEGQKIANLIDKGKSLEQIQKKIDKGHSYNTYGCAIAYGISNAKNKECAEKIRVEHNKEWGVEKDMVSIVNPAVFTIKEKR